MGTNKFKIGHIPRATKPLYASVMKLVNVEKRLLRMGLSKENNQAILGNRKMKYYYPFTADFNILKCPLNNLTQLSREGKPIV